jgi:hypothetical protein
MDIKFVPYQPEDVAVVHRFNQRMLDGGEHYEFSDRFISGMFRRNEHCNLHQELFLAKDETGEVRGGYYFKIQEYDLKNEAMEIVFMQLPISEGIINRDYKHVGPMIFEDMVQRQKLVFVLGMGGFQYPLPKRLKKLGWVMYLVPFYFYINKPRRFLSDFEYIKTLKKSLVKRISINIIKLFGILHLFTFIIKLHTYFYRSLKYKKYQGIQTERIEAFSAFADELWEQHKQHYSILAKRDQYVLNQLYPTTASKFHKLKITKNGICIGWIVMLCTKMEGDKYFGNLKLGSLIDAFSKPEDAELLIHQSVKYLRKLNADLIVVNHTNISWGHHFKRNGFLKGPSNFIFGISKRIKEYYGNNVDFEHSFLMRGDGDGPINL